MESMLKTKKQGLLIVLSGPSGCGKNTIINKVMENNKNIWLSISCTSREPRGEEKNGVNYYFLSREDLKQETQKIKKKLICVLKELMKRLMPLVNITM